jgi:hypothetical protein
VEFQRRALDRSIHSEASLSEVRQSIRQPKTPRTPCRRRILVWEQLAYIAFRQIYHAISNGRDEAASSVVNNSCRFCQVATVAAAQRFRGVVPQFVRDK